MQGSLPTTRPDVHKHVYDKATDAYLKKMASLIRTEPEKDGDLGDLLNTFKDTDQSNTDEGGATEEFLVITDGSDTDEDRGSQNVLDYGSLERFLFGFFI